MDSGEVHFI